MVSIRTVKKKHTSCLHTFVSIIACRCSLLALNTAVQSHRVMAVDSCTETLTCIGWIRFDWQMVGDMCVMEG